MKLNWIRNLFISLFFLIAAITNTIVADASPIVTDLGKTSGSSGAAISLTTSVSVPTGALIVAIAYEKSTGNSGTGFADTVGNSYISDLGGYAPDNNTSYGIYQVYWSYNSIALPSGDTITFTRHTSGDAVVLEAFYVTGIWKSSDPFDAYTGSECSGGNACYGSSTSPSANTAVPTYSNDLFVGIVAYYSSSSTTPTQDSTNAAWATPPDYSATGSINIQLFGGTFVATDGLSHIYAPTLPASVPWSDYVMSFRSLPTSNFIFSPAFVP